MQGEEVRKRVIWYAPSIHHLQGTACVPFHCGERKTGNGTQAVRFGDIIGASAEKSKAAPFLVRPVQESLSEIIR